MEIKSRLKRATKELLGKKQWPKKESIKPTCYEEQIYSALVLKDDTCYDVGANIGEVALYLAKLVGEDGLIVAFEPVWPMYQRLCQGIQRDLALKPPIVTVPAGLSNANYAASIQVPDSCFGMGSLAASDAWLEAQSGGEILSYDVNLLSVDTFISSSRIPAPDFMKIDVEGAELLTLQGAKSLLSSDSKPLIFAEVFAPWEKAFNYHPWELLSYLRSFGYQFIFACPEGLLEYSPTRETPFPPEYRMGYNLIAYDPNQHKKRIEACSELMMGSNPELLDMAPPPRPNEIIV